MNFYQEIHRNHIVEVASKPANKQEHDAAKTSIQELFASLKASDPHQPITPTPTSDSTKAPMDVDQNRPASETAAVRFNYLDTINMVWEYVERHPDLREIFSTTKDHIQYANTMHSEKE
jgi:hypothetical protein